VYHSDQSTRSGAKWGEVGRSGAKWGGNASIDSRTGDFI
jgi:hypothetical protein